MGRSKGNVTKTVSEFTINIYHYEIIITDINLLTYNTLYMSAYIVRIDHSSTRSRRT